MSRLFLTPSSIINGTNALEESGNILCNLGKKAFIVTDSMMGKLGNLNKITNTLKTNNIQYFVYDGISGEPTDEMINKGVDLFKNSDCDFFIALGGGSPIDSMKAIAMMSAANANIDDMMNVEMNYDRKPMVAIPTTAGTGSEATQFTIITNTKDDVKMLLKGHKVIPDVAIIDPQFTMTAPKSVTAATGLDALCHCVEAYTSKKAQPLSDTFALSAVNRIVHSLYTCYIEPTNEDARIQMSLAATEAGIAFNNSSVTIIHGMSRPIGALYHIAHGLSNAMLMVNCFEYVCDAAYDRFADVARASGVSSSDDDKIATEEFIRYLKELLKKLEIPSLKDYGVDEKDFLANIPKMTKDAIASGSPANTIKNLDSDEISALYKKSYYSTGI